MNYTPSQPSYSVYQQQLLDQQWQRELQRAQQERQRWLLILGGVALVGLLVLLPLFLSLAFYGYYQVTERIVPGVSIGALDLGGKTRSEAAVAIQAAWNLQRQVIVEDGQQQLSVAPWVVGLEVDSLATAEEAYRVAHDQPLLSEVNQLWFSMRKGWGIAPRLAFDRQSAQTGLEGLVPNFSQPARDAALVIENGRLVAAPSAPGYTVDIQEALNRIEADPLGSLLSGSLHLNHLPVAPRITDVSQALAEAERLLASPVSIRAYDAISNEWLDLPVPPEAKAAWLRVENTEQGPKVTFDSALVATYLASASRLPDGRWYEGVAYTHEVINAAYQGAAVNVLLKHGPSTYTIQSGDTLLKIGWKTGLPYWKIAQANPGLDEKALWAGQEITIPSKDELLPLPIIMNKRVVISISQQHMWVYQDGQEIKSFVISTGIDRSPTQPGIFQIQTHEVDAYASVWDLNMPHFLGIYESWPGFMNGIHGLPTLSNGRRLWANILGKPASYGCIILDLKPAEWLFNWAEDGVIVEIIE